MIEIAAKGLSDSDFRRSLPRSGANSGIIPGPAITINASL